MRVNNPTFAYKLPQQQDPRDSLDILLEKQNEIRDYEMLAIKPDTFLKTQEIHFMTLKYKKKNTQWFRRNLLK